MAEIDASRQRAVDFTQRFIDSGCDPRSLPQHSFSHADGSPPQGLDEAIARADLIVTGRITNTRFINGEPFNPSAESTLAIDLTVKGTASGQITLVQSGGPVPSSDGGAIGHLEGDPVLLAGDEVILLAKERPGTDGYVGLYPVGKYYIRDGNVHTPEGNPCDSIDGLTEADVLQSIRASLEPQPHDPVFPTNCNWARFQ